MEDNLEQTSGVSELLTLSWLTSPALPIGTFSFSQGLEYLLDSGLLKDDAALQQYLTDELRLVLPFWDLPLLLAMYEALAAADYARFTELNLKLISGRESFELWQEEKLTGAALFRLMGSLDLLPKELERAELGYTATFALFAHALPESVQGCRPSGAQLTAAYAFALMQNKVTAACKIMPLGQTRGQRILLALLPEIGRAAQRALHCPEEDIGVSTALTMLGSCLHERQYSRLFRS